MENGEIVIQRWQGKEPLHHLESRIADIAADVVEARRTPFSRPIIYDTLSRHGEVIKTDDRSGAYCWKKGLLLWPDYSGLNEIARKVKCREDSTVFAGLIYRSQRDYMHSQGVEPKGNPNEVLLRLHMGERLFLGNYYSWKKTREYKLKRPPSHLFPVRLPYKLRTLMCFGLGIVGLIRRNKGAIIGATEIFIESVSVEYYRILKDLGGQDLVNYAFTYPHGKEALTYPDKVLDSMLATQLDERLGRP